MTGFPVSLGHYLLLVGAFIIFNLMISFLSNYNRSSTIIPVSSLFVMQHLGPYPKVFFFPLD